MCTLSFISREQGYILAMNRDELLSRGIASPPRIVRAGEALAVFPHEAEGGTWLAANEYGATLAVLNWNDAAKASTEKLKSRGLVIPAAIKASSATETAAVLTAYPLRGTLPFCLVGVFAREREVREWRWDGQRLAQTRHSWSARHWFSSGRSDEAAAAQRGAAFAAAGHDADAGSAEWLRRLHRSHVPEPGPFSVCVHREDAATVSYSEITCGPADLHFSYQPGHPCAGVAFSPPLTLRLAAEIGSPDA
jgi:hypothetical protein